MLKETKNRFVIKLWNANTAIDIGNILTELEYEITNQVKHDCDTQKDIQILNFALWLDKHYFQHQTKNNCYAKSEIDFTTDKVFTVEQLIEKFKRVSTSNAY
jgi:hypothetical protein